MLDQTALQTPESPEWWMAVLADALIDRNRNVRLATLQSYFDGVPPMLHLAASDRKGWYKFHEMSRTNMAKKVIRAKRDRMRVRSIHTAATTDDRGDEVAWSYWLRSALPVFSKEVHTDQLALSEGYVRVSQRPGDEQPIALRRDPRCCIAIEDPLDPLRTRAAFELLWDATRNTAWAYVWIRERGEDGEMRGRQYVAYAENQQRPRPISIPGITADAARKFGWWWPRLWFNPSEFTMRPALEDVDEDDRDDGPYCQTLSADVVPVFRFPTRDNAGEYETATPTLNRINRTICDRVILQAIQAYKQRALKQDAPAAGQANIDRLPEKDSKGNVIDWSAIFEPGPDALWKLPPGVDIWESKEINLEPIIKATLHDLKTLSAETDTPLPAVYDDINESADGAQYKRESHLFGTEDCTEIAGGKWAQVVACMFLFAPDNERYVGTGVQGKAKVDRGDPSQIRIDWAPAERHSLTERADADSKNKTLSLDDSARIIWGMSPEEVAANRERRKKDLREIPMQFRPSELPPGEADNQPAPPPAPGGAPTPPTPPPSPPAAG